MLQLGYVVFNNMLVQGPLLDHLTYALVHPVN